MPAPAPPVSPDVSYHLSPGGTPSVLCRTLYPGSEEHREHKNHEQDEKQSYTKTHNLLRSCRPWLEANESRLGALFGKRSRSRAVYPRLNSN